MKPLQMQNTWICCWIQSDTPDTKVLQPGESGTASTRKTASSERRSLTHNIKQSYQIQLQISEYQLYLLIRLWILYKLCMLLNIGSCICFSRLSQKTKNSPNSVKWSLLVMKRLSWQLCFYAVLFFIQTNSRWQKYVDSTSEIIAKVHI